MSNIITKVDIDLYSPTNYDVVIAQQGDKDSRFIEFSLYNNGTPYSIPSNVFIKFEGCRGDKSAFIKDVQDINSNIITVKLDEDILYYSGQIQGKVVLYNTSDNSILSSIPVRISNQKNPCDKNKIEKDNYSVINDLTFKINNLESISGEEVEKLNSEIERAKIAELEISSNLTNEINRAKKSELELQSAIQKEEERATTSENDIISGLVSEISRAKQSENILTSNLNSEIARAKESENTLSDVINTNKPVWDDKYTKTEIDNKFSALETNIDWKESVATYDDIATTYPNPIDGWTVNVNDSDYTYRYNGTSWVAISANAIPKATNSVDGLLSKEDHTNYDDANSKKHTHSNKSVLDGISSTNVSNWNSAKTHADSTHARIDATKVEKSSTNGNIKINGTETTVYTHPSGTNPHGTTKSDIGLDEVENKSSKTIRSEITKSNVTTALGYTPLSQTYIDNLLIISATQPTSQESGEWLEILS